MREVVSGSKKLLKELRSIGDNTESAINQALLETISKATERAKEALLNTDHTQAGGDDLVEEIGFKVRYGKGYVYAPFKTDTPQMRNRMFYAEYGAGWQAIGKAKEEHKVSNKKSATSKFRSEDGSKWWRYYATDHDKLESRGRYDSARIIRPRGKSGKIKQPYRYQNLRTGRWIGVTNTSAPARYMHEARKYIIDNAGLVVADKVLFAISRRRGGKYQRIIYR